MAKRRSFKGWLMHLIVLLIALAVALFCAALLILYIAENNPPERAGDNDTIIVLGAQVYGNGELSPQLELRMEAALREYERHPVPIIVCGAQGKNEPRTEGEAMRDWLLAHGVPQSDVTAETQSTDTRKNLINAMKLLPAGTRKVTIVTSDYHLPRAMALARDLGYLADGIGSPCKPEFWVKNHFREVLAWGKYFAVKWGVLK